LYHFSLLSQNNHFFRKNHRKRAPEGELEERPTKKAKTNKELFAEFKSDRSDALSILNSVLDNQFLLGEMLCCEPKNLALPSPPVIRLPLSELKEIFCCSK